MAACVKHLVGGGRSIGGVNHATAEISERMLRSFFLPPFQAAIEENIMTVMPGHNDINGIPAHSNKWLLTDIMRDELGFKGFYVTDMSDIENLIKLHRTATDQKMLFARECLPDWMYTCILHRRMRLLLRCWSW